MAIGKIYSGVHEPYNNFSLDTSTCTGTCNIYETYLNHQYYSVSIKLV